MLVDISKFDENDPAQHQMKILFGSGIMYGLRGNMEHTYMEVSNITHGEFPVGHPYEGEVYYGFDGLLDKKHKLGVHTDYVRNSENSMRIPKQDNDPTSSCIAGSIERYLKKLAPGQIRLYCKVIPYENRYVDASTGRTEVFYANSPLGKNAINKLFKDGAKILGLPEPESFCAHSLRAHFITNLANGTGVSDEERMVSSRHTSVASSAIYQERDGISESNKFAALGVRPPKKMRYDCNDLYCFTIIYITNILFFRISPETQKPSNPYVKTPTGPPPVTPSSSNTTPPTKTTTIDVYSSTQEAISDVNDNIEGLKKAFLPEMSERQRVVMRMGQEVDNLKSELFFLRDALKKSRNCQMELQRRLYYFEQREEDELVKQSIEIGRQNDMYERNRKYSVYAPSTFKRKF